MFAGRRDLDPIQQNLNHGRISQRAFEVVVGVFYGIAILAAIIRLGLHINIYRRFQVDDYFVIFGCICLTASTVLGFVNVDNLFWDEEVSLNPKQALGLLEQVADPVAHINTYERLCFSYPSILWAAIFAIKFAYLAFFRRLIDRVPRLKIYWRVTLGLCLISFPLCVVSVYVACMKWGLQAATCLEPVYLHRALGMAISDAVLDILTDFMIVVIPIWLLRSVQIKGRQKFVIGIFLSLNLFMTFTAAIRVSGLRYHGAFDVVWLYVWQHMEACVAVIVVSLTAFRSVFVSSRISRNKKAAKQNWYSSTIAAIKRRKASQNTSLSSTDDLPGIPCATLTGMRTHIAAVPFDEESGAGRHMSGSVADMQTVHVDTRISQFEDVHGT